MGYVYDIIVKMSRHDYNNHFEEIDKYFKEKLGINLIQAKELYGRANIYYGQSKWLLIKDLMQFLHDIGIDDERPGENFSVMYCGESENYFTVVDLYERGNEYQGENMEW